jgi:hypothetical protein
MSSLVADYGAVRRVLVNLEASLDPKAPPAPPGFWERFQSRLRKVF